jgi:hypothetical protein
VRLWAVVGGHVTALLLKADLPVRVRWYFCGVDDWFAYDQTYTFESDGRRVRRVERLFRAPTWAKLPPSDGAYVERGHVISTLTAFCPVRRLTRGLVSDDFPNVRYPDWSGAARRGGKR